MVNYIQLTWNLAYVLRKYRTCNSMVWFSKYKFNKLLNSVILFRVTSSIIYIQLYIYIYIYIYFNISLSLSPHAHEENGKVSSSQIGFKTYLDWIINLLLIKAVTLSLVVELLKFKMPLLRVSHCTLYCCYPNTKYCSFDCFYSILKEKKFRVV